MYKSSGEPTSKSTTKPQPGILAIDPDKPPIVTIWELLEAASTPETLKRFCRDRPDFRPLVTRFSTSDGLSDMVKRVTVYCDEFLLWEELVAEVKEERPQQYARFKPRL